MAAHGRTYHKPLVCTTVTVTVLLLCTIIITNAASSLPLPRSSTDGDGHHDDYDGGTWHLPFDTVKGSPFMFVADDGNDYGWWHATSSTRHHFAAFTSPSSTTATAAAANDDLHSIEWHTQTASVMDPSVSPSRHIQAVDFFAATLHRHLSSSNGGRASATGVTAANPSMTVNQLRLNKIRYDTHKATSHLSYTQIVDDVPVFGGEVRVHFNDQGHLTASSGVFIPGLHDHRAAPELTSDNATANAMAIVHKRLMIDDMAGNNTIRVKEAPVLMWLRPSTLRQEDDDIDNTYLVYRVSLSTREPINDIVIFIDSITGGMVYEMAGRADLLSRTVYAPTMSTVVWNEGAAFPTANARYNELLLSSKEAYNAHASTSGGTWLSYDGNSAPMKIWLNSNNQDPGFTYTCASSPNAFWDGTGVTHFCPQLVTDDIVAHEWSHAYTQYTDALIYSYQAGALNEGYSDVWGEVVDLLNGRGLDTPGGLRTANEGQGTSATCDINVSWRWILGEGSTGYPSGLRDMWHPECFDNPGRMLSPSYVCGSSDEGGVHTNSGVLNHFFALLVDGSTYNGQTVVGIGIHKATNIMWRTQLVYLVAMSTYRLFGAAVYQSCLDLVGLSLPLVNVSDPDAGNRWVGVTSPLTTADCDQVTAANLATQMATRPICSTVYVQGQNTPALCSIRSYILYEDFETGLDVTATGNGWTLSYSADYPATWITRNWYITPVVPGRTGQVVKGPSPAFACMNVSNLPTADQSGIIFLRSRVFTVPPGTTNLKMAFWNYFSFETGTSPLVYYDGGNIYIKINSAAATLLPNNTFTWNAYPRRITNTYVYSGYTYSNTNPLRGQLGFAGTGTTSNTEGVWTQSQVDLSSLVTGGDTFQLIFRVGTDSCSGFDGWYVDDIMVYSCNLYCSTTCINGGYCVASTSGSSSSWSCKCPTGWNGTSCEIDIAPPVFTVCPTSVSGNTSSGLATGIVTWTATATDNSGGTITYASSKASGSAFSYGITPVTITATDPTGNQANCSFTVTIIDTEPPRFTSCTNVTVNTTLGGASAVVTWPAVTAVDNVTPSPVIQTSAMNGSSFALGSTPVIYNATDDSGNVGYCRFTIVVRDIELPTLSACPDTIVTRTDNGSPYASVSWLPLNATDNTGMVTVTSTIGNITGGLFSIGNTSVTITAADPFDNRVSCSFLVVVRDMESPQWIRSCPTNITTPTDTSRANATINYLIPTANDNSGAAPTIVTTMVNGSLVAIGSTMVTVTATDTSSNSIACSFSVTVVDLEAPVWHVCPSNQSVAPATTSDSTARAVWSLGQVTDNSGASITIVCSHQSNDSFALGTRTTVICRATDVAGNVGTCIFGIRVVDDVTPPVWTNCPANITQTTSPVGSATRVVSWIAPNATDNSGHAPSITVNYPSGTTFPIGRTIVRYDATDNDGNVGTCTFTVTILDQEAPSIIAGCANITDTTDTGVATRAITYPAITTSDNSNGTVTVTTVPVSGSLFTIGSQRVLVSATDVSGNNGTCTFYVTIVDIEPPSWLRSCPSTISVPATNGAIAVNVTWLPPVATDNSGIVTVTASGYPTPNGNLSLGQNNITYRATDPSINVITCTFVIMVLDAQPPVISSCPSNQTTTVGLGIYNATFTWTPPTATDNSGIVTLTPSISPGAAFVWGLTPITYTATDMAGNVAICRFYITVIPTLPAVTFTGIPSSLTLVDGADGVRLATNMTLTASPSSLPVVVLLVPSLGTTLYLNASASSSVTIEGCDASDWFITSCTVRGSITSIATLLSTLQVAIAAQWPLPSTATTSNVAIVIRDSTNAATITSSNTVIALNCNGAAAPYALFTRITDTLDGMIVYMDRTPILSTVPTCASLFVSSTLLLGIGATCAYTIDGVQVTFGVGATILPDDPVYFRGGAVTRCSVSTQTTYATTMTLGGPLDPVMPSVIITGVTSLPSCTSLSLTATASNIGGRDATYVWQPVASIRRDVAVSYVGATYTLPYWQLPYGGNGTLNVTASNYLSYWSAGVYASVKSVPATVTLILALPTGITTATRDVVHTAEFVLAPKLTISGCTGAFTDSDATIGYTWTSSPTITSSVAWDATTRTLKLPAGVLSPGVNYTMTLTASMTNSWYYNHQPASTTFQLFLIVRAIPTVAIIYPTSRTLSTNTSILLDGSSSTYGGGQAIYVWSCKDGAGEVCKSPYYGGGALEIVPAGAATVTIPPARLLAGVYTFKLQVLGFNGVLGMTTVTITMVETSVAIPEVAFTSSTSNNDGVVNTDASLRLAATITTGMTYVWSVTSSPSFGSSVPSWVSQLGTSSFISLNPARTANFFTAGSVLTFTLDMTRTSTGATGRGIFIVTVQQSPVAGTFTVSPLSGTALATSFTLTASGFTDPENEGPLSYRFYRVSRTTGEIIWITGVASAASSLTLSSLPSGLPLTLGVRVYDVRGGWLSVTRAITISEPTVTPAATLTTWLSQEGNLVITQDIDQLLSLALSLLTLVDSSSNTNATVSLQLTNSIIETFSTSVTDWSNTPAMIQALLSLTTKPLDDDHTTQALTMMTALLNQLMMTPSVASQTLAVALARQLATIHDQLAIVLRTLFYSLAATSSSGGIGRRLLASSSSSSSTEVTNFQTLLTQALQTSRLLAYNGGVTDRGDIVAITQGSVSYGVIRLLNNFQSPQMILNGSIELNAWGVGMTTTQVTDVLVACISPNPLGLVNDTVASPVLAVQLNNFTGQPLLLAVAMVVTIPYSFVGNCSLSTYTCNVQCCEVDTNGWCMTVLATQTTKLGQILCTITLTDWQAHRYGVYATSTYVGPVSSSSSSTATYVNNDSSSSNTSAIAAIAAGTVGSIVVVMIFIAVIVYYCRKDRKRADLEIAAQVEGQGHSPHGAIANHRLSQPAAEVSVGGRRPSAVQMTFVDSQRHNNPASAVAPAPITVHVSARLQALPPAHSNNNYTSSGGNGNGAITPSGGHSPDHHPQQALLHHPGGGAHGGHDGNGSVEHHDRNHLSPNYPSSGSHSPHGSPPAHQLIGAPGGPLPLKLSASQSHSK